MKKSILKYNIFLLLFIIFTSCTDVINVDLPKTNSRLVVEASINWEKGTKGNEQTIKLSTSTAYFDKNTNTPVTGATVTITKKNDGKEFIFTDQKNGNYTTTNFIPEIGTSYTLKIINNGKTYTAKEKLIGITKINNVLQEKGFRDKQFRIRVLFNDPKEEKNYYMGEFTQKNLAIPSLKAIRDEFINGNEAFILHSNKKNVTDTKIDIKVFGISEQFYFYLSQLIKQSGTGRGGPFQPTPAKLKGNCKNINNPNEEVLGYFRLSEFSKTNYTIK